MKKLWRKIKAFLTNRREAIVWIDAEPYSPETLESERRIMRKYLEEQAGKHAKEAKIRYYISAIEQGTDTEREEARTKLIKLTEEDDKYA